jgi:hypothetical protein
MRSSQLILLAGALTLGLVVAGCSNKKDASTTANPAAEPANPAAAPAASPAQARVERETSFQTKDLQLSVEAYEKIYKRKPASLEQMVQEGFLASLPAAPPGKRFTLDPATARVSAVPR